MGEGQHVLPSKVISKKVVFCDYMSKHIFEHFSTVWKRQLLDHDLKDAHQHMSEHDIISSRQHSARSLTISNKMLFLDKKKEISKKLIFTMFSDFRLYTPNV